MPDLDILSSTYAGQAPGSGFDIIGNVPGRPPVGPNGQPLPASGQSQAQQPQGAPMSGLMAGVLGLPTQGGPIPGAAYAMPGQIPAQGQAPVATPQVSGLAAALGMGARSLFDGVVGGGR